MTGKSFQKQNEVGLTAFKQQAKLAKTKAKVTAAKKASADRKTAVAATVKVQTKAHF